MYVDHQMKFEFYVPEELEIGMIFVNILLDHIDFWELTELPEDFEKFINENGLPVSFIIVNDLIDLLAEGEEISWVDLDPSDDDLMLVEISLSFVNDIFQNYDGIISMMMDEETEYQTPFIYEEKVIISYST